MRDGGVEGMVLVEEPLLGAAGIGVEDGAFDGRPRSGRGFSGFSPSDDRQSDGGSTNDGCAWGCEENWYESNGGLCAGANTDGGDSAAPGCAGADSAGGCKARGN